MLSDFPVFPCAKASQRIPTSILDIYDNVTDKFRDTQTEMIPASFLLLLLQGIQKVTFLMLSRLKSWCIMPAKSHKVYTYSYRVSLTFQHPSRFHYCSCHCTSWFDSENIGVYIKLQNIVSTCDCESTPPHVMTAFYIQSKKDAKVSLTVLTRYVLTN